MLRIICNRAVSHLFGDSSFMRIFCCVMPLSAMLENSVIAGDSLGSTFCIDFLCFGVRECGKKKKFACVRSFSRV